MTRQPFVRSDSSAGAATYRVWLADDVYLTVRSAPEKSGLSWPEWAEKAITRLERTDPDELGTLINTWKRGRAGKTALSFRINNSTLQRAKNIAQQYEGTVQAVFAHAFFMEALAQTLSLNNA